MSFVEHVRRNRVPSPPQRAFAVERWTAAFDSVGDRSREDIALYEAGIWFAERLASARGAWTRMPRLEHAPSDLARALVGTVNFQTARSAQRVIRDIGNEPIAERQRHAEALAEGVQHLVTSLKVPVANALGGIEPEGPPSADARAVVNGMRQRLYLGQQYTALQILWNQCVMHGWRVFRAPQSDVVAPSDERRERWFAAAHFRRDTIASEMVVRASMKWARMNPRRRLEVADVPVVRTVERHARRLRLQLGPTDANSPRPPFAWVARVLAREQYLEDIIDTALSAFDGLSARELLNTLWVLSPLAELLVADGDADEELATLADCLGYAPRLHRDDIVDAVAQALNVPRARADRTVTILTFNGTPRDDLWPHSH